MELTEIEKEELFNDFMLRLSKTSKEDRKLSVAKNNHALKGVARYYWDNYDPTNIKLKHDPKLFLDTGDPVIGEIYRYCGFYNIYLKLRAAIPSIVMAKKHRNKEHSYKETHRNPEFSDNPYLEDDDIEEATIVGKILLDAAFNYLSNSEDCKNE